jgi:hypothetical protein
MRALVAILACTAALNAVPVNAQDACPCVPVTHLWTVKTCADWNCAAAELAVANGDPQVVAVPVALTDMRWLILRRMAAGAAAASGNDSFRVEQFDHMSAATERFMAVDHDHQPMLFTTPDGRMLVVSLKEPELRRRAAPHE